MRIYAISRGYKQVVVFHGDDKTHERVGTSTIEPNRELSRREKYTVIADELEHRFHIPRPPYQPLKSEVGDTSE